MNLTSKTSRAAAAIAPCVIYLPLHAALDAVTDDAKAPELAVAYVRADLAYDKAVAAVAPIQMLILLLSTLVLLAACLGAAWVVFYLAGHVAALFA